MERRVSVHRDDQESHGGRGREDPRLPDLEDRKRSKEVGALRVIAVKYAPDFGEALTRYRSCDRCGINMQLNIWSLRKECDDCIDFDVFEFGKFDWLFQAA